MLPGAVILVGDFGMLDGALGIADNKAVFTVRGDWTSLNIVYVGGESAMQNSEYATAAVAKLLTPRRHQSRFLHESSRASLSSL